MLIERNSNEGIAIESSIFNDLPVGLIKEGYIYSQTVNDFFWTFKSNEVNAGGIYIYLYVGPTENP